MNRRVVALPLDQSVTWDAQEDRAGKEVECGVYLRGVQKVGGRLGKEGEPTVLFFTRFHALFC